MSTPLLKFYSLWLLVLTRNLGSNQFNFQMKGFDMWDDGRSTVSKILDKENKDWNVGRNLLSELETKS